jgi:sodium-independent sulfate anion transporter 11
MDEKKKYLSASGYNLRGSSYSLNIPQGPISGYRGSNEFICKAKSLTSLNNLYNHDFHTVTDDPQPQTLKEKIQQLPELLKNKARNACRKKILYKRFPIMNWLPNYSMDDAVGDLVAGFTVGLTVIPQALAYAGIAGLPAAYGLYGSFLGCFVYIFLGSCKDVPMGPTAIASLLTYQAARGSWQKAVLLCLLTGIIELIMGLFGLGFLIDFVSGPVSSGFTSAVALIILSSQVKDLFGIKGGGNTFIEMWTKIFENIGEYRMSDSILGVICIVVLLCMRVS